MKHEKAQILNHFLFNFVLLILILSLITSLAEARTIKSMSLVISILATGPTAELGWDANAEPDLAGYRIYYGNSVNVLSQKIQIDRPVPVNGRISQVVSGLTPGNTYYFVIKAFDNSGNESLPSTQVSKAF